jgi:tRNA (adenine57-N1/adenine58-N1)-methyltransferase
MIASKELFAEAGERVLVETWPDEWQLVTLERGGVLQTRFGAFYHDDFIGRKKAGYCWYGRRTRRAGAFLRTLPARFHTAVPKVTNRRTQVIYSVDVASLICRLELEPGSLVVEAGTGSGRLTCLLAQTVAPCGQVHTYECHESRFLAAREEIQRHLREQWPMSWTRFGWSPEQILYFYHQDVRVEGFCRPEAASEQDTRPTAGSAHAVILDMPEPHLVVQATAAALQPGLGVLAAFLPSVEQVWRLQRALLCSNAFHSVQVWSNISRAWQSVIPAAAGSASTPTVWSRAAHRPHPNGAHTGYVVVARRQACLEASETLVSIPIVSWNKRARLQEQDF